MTEKIIYGALLLGTLAYPFWAEDRITFRTALWAVLFAIFTPITTFIYVMNHKQTMLRRRGDRIQRAERERREANSN